jgi:ATP-binding cassette subfamily F protein uup
VAAPVAAAPPLAAAAPAAPRTKRSYKEQRELDALPARIAALEAEQKAIAEAIADPSLYAKDPQRATDLHARYAQIDEELLAALERWEALG